MTHDALTPAPIDVRSLDPLAAAVIGGLMQAPPGDAARALSRLRTTDVESPVLRLILEAVRAVNGRGQIADPVTVAAHVRAEGMVPVSSLPHLGVLLADLYGVNVSPAGAGELEKVPDVVNASARRSIAELAARLAQLVEDCSDTEVREHAPDLARSIWSASQRITVPEAVTR